MSFWSKLFHGNPALGVRLTPAVAVTGPQPWAPEAVEFVQIKQEREYRALSESLGLGADPAKSYAQLTRGRMPFAHVQSGKLRHEFGAEHYLSSEEWSLFDRGVATLYDRYFSLEPPTPYEDPNRYPSMAMTFDGLQEELTKRGHALYPRPFLATLPSGEVNAITAEEPTTGVKIIFFEQGLFQFFYDFALLIGWATPQMSPQQLSDDAALAQLPRQHTMPPQASEFFVGSLEAYVVEGNSTVNSSSLPRPSHNMFTVMMLITQMERFLMAHELAHIGMGHLNDAPSNESAAWQQEFDADAAGVALATSLAYESLGGWAVGFWACDLALTAMNFLDRAIGLLAFGPGSLAWTSKTHPDALSRRSRIRDQAAAMAQNVPNGLDAASELCGMSDALLQRLWEIAHPLLVLAYKQGARPSPLWHDWIARSFSPGS